MAHNPFSYQSPTASGLSEEHGRSAERSGHGFGEGQHCDERLLPALAAAEPGDAAEGYGRAREDARPDGDAAREGLYRRYRDVLSRQRQARSPHAGRGL